MTGRMTIGFLACMLFGYGVGWYSHGFSEDMQEYARWPDREAGAASEAGESPPELEGGAPAYPDLREELAQARDRIAELEAAAAKAPTPTPAAAPTKRARVVQALPEGIWPVAERVGAPKALVELAWKLRSGAFQDPKEAEAALATLKAAGKEGLLAFAALSLGPATGHTNIPGFIAKLGVADADVILIDLIESNEHPHGLVGALGLQDTQRSRDFLVDYLPKHVKDPALYWYTATSLGQLKESRGAKYIDVQAITQPRWGGVRGYILYSLGEMGGPDAQARLVEYLETPHADKLGAAASALAKLDKDAARRHAKRLLASDRAKFIHWMDRSTLEKLAKEE